jgi:hypothetical protein
VQAAATQAAAHKARRAATQRVQKLEAALEEASRGQERAHEEAAGLAARRQEAEQIERRAAQESASASLQSQAARRAEEVAQAKAAATSQTQAAAQGLYSVYEQVGRIHRQVHSLLDQAVKEGIVDLIGTGPYMAGMSKVGGGAKGKALLETLHRIKGRLDGAAALMGS